MSVDTQHIVEIPIHGMDCTSCVNHIRQAINTLPGIQSVDVLLSAEKAVICFDPAHVDEPALQRVIEQAGYSVSQPEDESTRSARQHSPAAMARSLLTLLGLIFGAVILAVLIGERLGLLKVLTERVPWPVWAITLIIAGYPVFRNVIRAALRRQIISHTLMTLGVVAALAIGDWGTALVIVFFMRVGDYVEHFTAERARRAVKDLTRMAPRTARVQRGETESQVPIAEVRTGDIVIVRPGEQIPVDGEVIDGQATVDQATITGESMPIEVGPGSAVFAATIAQLGSLRLRVTRVGADTTFGQVIKLVEEAEAHRADVQRTADRFAAYYLPIVAAIAGLTLLLRGDPLAMAAVLAIACSCSFALATPIALLASIGAGARHGLLIKGGKYLEALARADVLLIDKTGTLTFGKPQITNILPLDHFSETHVLALAASVERYSEHPLAEAVRKKASHHGLPLQEPQQFEALPGIGVRARVDGQVVIIGSRRLLPSGFACPQADALEAQGKTLLFVLADNQPIGVIAAADTIRPEISSAIAAVRDLEVKHIELLTGDHEQTAAGLAAQLGIDYRAGLLPENKIAIVRDYQARGHRVIMVGDGVNDAPALAQADIGIAMGVAGSDVAFEAAHMALMREDWGLVPDALRMARRTMRIVKLNLGFAAVYNGVGLTLAALGFLPPIFAAAAQSLPDLGILANSSRLLRYRRRANHAPGART